MNDKIVQADFNDKIMEKRRELEDALDRVKQIELDIEALYDEQLDKVRGMYDE